MHSNYAGICNERLYQETFEGSKWLIEEFIGECQKSLVFVSETKTLNEVEKRTYFNGLKKTFGMCVQYTCIPRGKSDSYDAECKIIYIYTVVTFSFRSSFQLCMDFLVLFWRSFVGETVLCLSGGGAMGHYHFGVVRVLLDEGMSVY